MIRRLRHFLSEERGAGSVFMVSMLPVFVGLAGLAIDAADAYRMRNMLQSAADAAALAATLQLPDTTAARDAAISYAKLNLPNRGDVLIAADVEAGNWNATKGTFTKGGNPINSMHVTTRLAAARGNALPTTFLRIIGIDHWDITTEAVSVADQPKLWVALVLDNSLSMCEPGAIPCPNPAANSKITNLKNGAKKLLNTLKAASTHSGDVQVAIVPFTKNVSLGPSYVNASWLNWSDFNRAPPTPATSVGPGKSCPWTADRYGNGYTCQTNSTNDAPTTATIPTSGMICPTASGSGYSAGNSTGYKHYFNGCFDSKTLTTDRSGKATSWSHTWIPNSKSTWTGCVMDRDQDYDTLNTIPSTGGTMVYPENNPTYCTATTPTITPLHVLADVTDVSYFSDQIKMLAATGWTNQGIGFDFGWLALTPGMPLTPATPALPRDTERYIILFSDGFNTVNRWTTTPNPNIRDTGGDARTTTACTNAKKDGIVIFTVYVDTNPNPKGSSVLEACASDPKSDYYFPLTTSGAIITTFDKISQRIMKTRLVH